MLEAPRGNDHGQGRACLEAKLGSPAPCCQLPMAKRPQSRLRSGLEHRSQALVKEVREAMENDHKGDENLPKSRDNGRPPPPPMPPTPTYTHPSIKRRDWSLKGKSRLPGVGDDGAGAQGSREGPVAAWLSTCPGKQVRGH